MAPADCTLDDRSLAMQLDRYRRLGRMAENIHASELEVQVTLAPDVDLDLVRETIAIERECCSFFRLDYDASEHRLSVALDDSARRDALRALLSALRDGTSSAADANASTNRRPRPSSAYISIMNVTTHAPNRVSIDST
jgi:hypothetical protein